MRALLYIVLFTPRRFIILNYPMGKIIEYFALKNALLFFWGRLNDKVDKTVVLLYFF